MKRRFITTQKKTETINLAKKVRNSQTARRLGVHESHIRYWRKQESELLTCKKGSRSLIVAKVKCLEIKIKLVESILDCGQRGIAVNRVKIRIQARKLTMKHQIYEFKAGSFWGNRFVKKMFCP
uniref:HTH psq-type domain-containing protein n=1 Tax=Strongyloides venezuelensis TaxID=75913 RepID=A0A0K0FDD6_STRVS